MTFAVKQHLCVWRDDRPIHVRFTIKDGFRCAQDVDTDQARIRGEDDLPSGIEGELSLHVEFQGAARQDLDLPS